MLEVGIGERMEGKRKKKRKREMRFRLKIKCSQLYYY
jgi:hypothetical protein